MQTGWEQTPEKLEAAYCLGCHETSHAEWSRGQHAHAWTDPVFQEAFDHEPRQWCVNCHAPLESQEAAWRAEGARAPELQEGINCAACHVRQGEIISIRVGNCDAGVVRARESFGSAEFCAGCHQFNFPTATNPLRYSDEPMQNTFAEWQAAGSKNECHQCHYAGHELVGGKNTDRMPNAFYDFSAERDEGATIRLAFRIADRGHILPTGDLYRSIALEAAYDPGFQRVYYRRRWARYYQAGRRNETAPEALIWNRDLKRNSGIRPEQDRITLTIDAPAGPVYIRLIRRFHDQSLGGRSRLPLAKRSATIWSTVVY